MLRGRILTRSPCSGRISLVVACDVLANSRLDGCIYALVTRPVPRFLAMHST